MSNKPFDKLNPVDRLIRSSLPVRMTGGSTTEVRLTIELLNGFEIFNTRPYHNYETWSDGYRVSGERGVVEAEDLDDALLQYFNKEVEP